MVVALKTIVAAEGWQEEATWVWVDYASIPQRCRGSQQIAINSLAMYTSVAHAFCIVAPSLTHEAHATPLDVHSYNRRLWCRVENFCHSVRQLVEKWPPSL